MSHRRPSARLLLAIALLLPAAVRLHAAELDPDFQARAMLTLRQASGASSVMQEESRAGDHVFVARFGVARPVDTRGYYKLVVGAGVAEDVKAGFQSLGSDPRSGIESAWRSVDRSASQRWNEAYARVASGNVVMMVQGRRPFGEEPARSGREMTIRLEHFVRLAREQGLLDEPLKSCVQTPGAPAGSATGDGLSAPAAELRQKIEAWRTGNLDAVPMSELEAALPTALTIAKANGMDVVRLQRIWELTKKVIREGAFRDPEDPRPSDWAAGLSAAGAANLAEYEARRQAVRVRFYKRLTAAFLDALLASREMLPPCCVARDGPQRVSLDGVEIPRLGCPDPVVERFSRYANAIRQIDAAESEHLQADYEILVQRQQLLTDILSVAPLVGDGMDIYSVYSGEDLAGNCLSPFERGLTALFVAIPILGPDALKFATKRSPWVAENLGKLSAYLDATMNWMGELGEGVAKRWGTGKAQVASLAETLRQIELDVADMPGLDREAKEALMMRLKHDATIYEILRDAAEDRVWINNLPPELRAKAEARAEQILRAYLNGVQGSREAVVRASNMVAKHLDAIEVVARERGEILVFRSVNPDARRLIEEGFATKGMNVKGKSADWGPHAGFIPVEQKFSKLGNPSKPPDAQALAEVQAFHDKVAKCLRKGECRETPAVMGNGDAILTIPDPAAGRDIPVIRDKHGNFLDADTRKPLELSPDQRTRAQPMMVLADDQGRALTADYDFLAFGMQGRHRSPHFDPERGFIEARQRASLEEINGAVAGAGYEGGYIAHHGAENWYPMSPGAMKVDPVVTVVDPQRGLITIPRCDAACMQKWCDNTQACGRLKVCGEAPQPPCIPIDPDRLLKDYFHDARLRGFNLDPNAVWNWGNYNVTGGWTVRAFLDEGVTAQWRDGGVQALIDPALAQAARRAIVNGVTQAGQVLFSCNSQRRPVDQ